MNYSEIIPYLSDGMDELISQIYDLIKSNTKPVEYVKIIKELEIYFNYIKKLKIGNPDKIIDDHVVAILFSYAVNPNLSILDRDAYYNGIWYSIRGSIDGLNEEEIKNKCINLNPSDQRWTEVCMTAVEEYFKITNKESKWGKINIFKMEKNN